MSQKIDTKIREINTKDLPLTCPLPDMQLWNAHPRVFLEIDKSVDRTIVCPYCSTTYKLID